MHTRRLLLLLSVLIVGLGCIGMLLLQKEAHLKSKLNTPEPPGSDPFKQPISPMIQSGTGYPVNKSIVGNNEQVVWEILAEVVQPFQSKQQPLC